MHRLVLVLVRPAVPQDLVESVVHEMLLPYDEDLPVEYDEENETCYNPDGEYDWYEIGGRWAQPGGNIMRFGEVPASLMSEAESMVSSLGWDVRPWDVWPEPNMDDFKDWWAVVVDMHN